MTDESAECYSSAVNAKNADSEVGETQRAQVLESTEGRIVEEGKKQLLRRIPQWRWKDIFTAVVLWFGYLFVNAAYSTIVAFFPNTVGEHS